MYGRPSALETHAEDDALDLASALPATTGEVGPAAISSLAASPAPSSWMGSLFSPAASAAQPPTRSPEDARGLLAAISARPSPASQAHASPSRPSAAPATPLRHARGRYSGSALLSPAPSLATSGVTVSPSVLGTDEARTSPLATKAASRDSLRVSVALPAKASVERIAAGEQAAGRPVADEFSAAAVPARARSHMRRQSSVDLPNAPTTPLHDRVHAVREGRTSATASTSAADRLRMALAGRR